MRLVRAAVLAAVAGTFVLVPMQAGHTAGPEGCVVTNPANPEFKNPCTYTATVKGGIVGAGTFKVVIKRGTKTYTYTNKQGNRWSIGVIHPSDKVTATAVSPGSFVATGNPCRQSIPGAC
jgi:hypothetical protein